ncbi:MAG: SusD/RagB family nutrient-binding outer membrane lipoprotein [Gemmatimonadaceae bacterium]
MINKKFLRVGAGVALTLAVAGCNNDKLTALNTNPNSPEQVPPGPLFTNAVRLSVARWFGGYDLRTAEWVTQQLSEIQYTDEDRYVRMHAADTEGSFNGAYSGELKDLTQIVIGGEAAKEPGTYGPALAMRVWGFSYLTDSWGDVPYTNALKGDSVGSSLAPAYDKQADIYNDFFASLDKAAKDLAGASNTLGSADPIYGGSPAKWQKFINSLRARLAMRIVNVNPTLANTQLTAAINGPGGLILTNADNAQLTWPGDGVYNNPWSDNLGARDDWRVSNRLTDLMNANSDPRLPIFVQPTPSGTYQGSPNGISTTRAVPLFNATSRPGTIFYKGKTTYGPTFGGAGARLPTFILSAADVNFILAEAAQRGMGGLNAGQAAGYYTTGVSLSLAQWSAVAPAAQTISAAATASYLAQPGVVYKGGTPGLIQIAERRWLALFTDGGQAWFEWRRTCRPATVVAGIDATLNDVPRRLEYATLETQVNLESVTAAVNDQGPDLLTTRVYWDKSPTAAPTYFVGCGVKNGT